MKKSAILALGAMLVAGSALASNTGFKLNYPLQFQAGRTNTNWLSLPLFYFPNGNVSVTTQNSLDLCSDLNDFVAGGPKVTSVVKWLVTTQVAQPQSCTGTTKLAFNIIKGESYAAVPSGAGQVVNIVGSMDDTYAPNKQGTARYPLQYVAGGTNTNWVSVPYHTTADNALDLCAQWNAQTGSKVPSVVKWLVTTQVAQPQSCTGTTKLAFNVVPGEGYAAVPSAAGVSIGWNVY